MKTLVYPNATQLKKIRFWLSQEFIRFDNLYYDHMSKGWKFNGRPCKEDPILFQLLELAMVKFLLRSSWFIEIMDDGRGVKIRKDSSNEYFGDTLFNACFYCIKHEFIGK